ncbi:MAG: hypothetical protein ABIQ93_15995 [Saprospiraceae bacterium]
MITKLDFHIVRAQYEERENAHLQLRRGLAKGVANAEVFTKHALGITDSHANYSASEHKLGPVILVKTPPERVFKLAQKLDGSPKNHVPKVIYDFEIPSLKISVGSELAMMLRPDDLWVGNRRTFWTHILVTNGWKRRPANMALKLFQQNDPNAEMDYGVWKYLYLDIEKSLIEVADKGAQLAKSQGIVPGNHKFLWADAIATSLYESRD